MIRALVTGSLVKDPEERTTRNGNPFAIAKVTVPTQDQGRFFCSVIAFDERAVTRLLELKQGASISLSGMLKVSTWTAPNGEVRPNLDLTADEVASTTPRPKARKESRASSSPVAPSGSDLSLNEFSDDVPDFGGAQ